MTVAVHPLLSCPLVVSSPKLTVVTASAPPIRNVMCRRSQSSQLISGPMDRTLLVQKLLLLFVSCHCVRMYERWKQMEATAESNHRFNRTGLVFFVVIFNPCQSSPGAGKKNDVEVKNLRPRKASMIHNSEEEDEEEPTRIRRVRPDVRAAEVVFICPFWIRSPPPGRRHPPVLAPPPPGLGGTGTGSFCPLWFC